MNEYPYPCHHCRKELGNDWVEISTPVCPVRVHKKCKDEYTKRMNMIVRGMFEAGRNPW